jgi:DNA repair protein RadD
MVQMIGRGLRTIDPEIYPNIIKKDCVVLDFGTSILTHGSVDETINLDGTEKNGDSEALTKNCPKCHSVLPLNARECPMCGHVFNAEKSDESLAYFEMTEVDIMQNSPFRWVDMVGNGNMMMASGFEGFGLIATMGDTSMAIVKKRNDRLRTVAIGTKKQSMASADDFLRQIETSSAANKSKRWLNHGLSEKQINQLNKYGMDVNFFDLSWNKYKGTCWLNYLWNKSDIDNMVKVNGI